MSDKPAAFATADEAEAAFYAAFAAIDLAAMGAVWLDSAGVVCVHPGGGLLRGRAEVMQSWAEILTGVSPPSIEHRLIERLAAGDQEVHVVEESIRAGGDAQAAPNRVLATNVYRLGPDGWRMLVHHASLPLMVKRREPDSGRQLH
jgi:ketosteroid isomerase-like protein